MLLKGVYCLMALLPPTLISCRTIDFREFAGKEAVQDSISYGGLEFTAIDEKKLAGFTKLSDLIIRNTSIHELPKELCSLVNLWHLNLANRSTTRRNWEFGAPPRIDNS
jgi:hypothetical protein